MSVEIVGFIKHTVDFGLSEYDMTPEVVMGAKAASDLESFVMKSARSFSSLRELEHSFAAIDLEGYGLEAERTGVLTPEDTLSRITFEEQGINVPEDAAVMFLRIYARELGSEFLGTMMVRYNSELEL